jgi:transposase
MTMPQDGIGVDIAKSWIDVHVLSTHSDQRIPTTDQGLGGFAQAARGAFVTFEASGFYTRALSQALDKAGVSYARLTPR